jgi:hypothetical protein
MRQIATMAENHHLRLSAARNFKNCTSAALVIPSIPHEMNELGLSLFRVYGRALARQLEYTNISAMSANAVFLADSNARRLWAVLPAGKRTSRRRVISVSPRASVFMSDAEREM